MRIKAALVTYIKYYGVATALLIFGYFIGRNVLFSPHGGIGWLLLAFMSLGGAAVGIVEIVLTHHGQSFKRLGELFLVTIIYLGAAFTLLSLMPDTWNDWFIPYLNE
jgi:hypothetical protein